MEPSILVLFSYGLCNLNCVYCSIDKNKYLKDIDNLLKESFDNYQQEYCPRIEKYFKHEGVQKIELWGGEPLMGIDRIFPLLDWVIEKYPAFDELFFSTNFSYLSWADKIMSILRFFEKYPNRKFELNVQLSLDGPEYINDANRGKNTTKLCLANIERLCKKLKEENLPENVTIRLYPKPTLSIDTVATDLQTRENIEAYYNFYVDNLAKPIESVNKPTVSYQYTIPNLVSPSKVTRADGEKFANMCKITHEMENDFIKQNNSIRFYTLYSNLIHSEKDIDAYNFSTANCLKHSCGSGYSQVFMLPRNMYCTCNIAYTDIVSGYKEYIQNNRDQKITNLDYYLKYNCPFSVLSEEEHELYRKNQEQLHNCNSTSTGALTFAMIKMLAESGQIEEKYKLDTEIYKAMSYLQFIDCRCIYNNQVNNGSLSIQGLDAYRLFLNGALEYVVCPKGM